MRYLLDQGVKEKEMISLTLQQLKQLSLPVEGKLLMEQYLEKKKELNHSSSLAFTTPDDKQLKEEQFSDYLLGARRTRMSMEFNACYCQGFLKARYHLPAAHEVS